MNLTENMRNIINILERTENFAERNPFDNTNFADKVADEIGRILNADVTVQFVLPLSHDMSRGVRFKVTGDPEINMFQLNMGWNTEGTASEPRTGLEISTKSGIIKAPLGVMVIGNPDEYGTKIGQIVKDKVAE